MKTKVTVRNQQCVAVKVLPKWRVVDIDGEQDIEVRVEVPYREHETTLEFKRIFWIFYRAVPVQRWVTKTRTEWVLSQLLHIRVERIGDTNEC